MKKIILFFLTIFLFVFAALYLYRENTGQFILVNKSSEIIANVKVEVCGQIFEAENIQPNEKYTGSHKIKNDSGYNVVVSFDSGREISDQLGYVTSGFDFTHTITINDSSIFINSTQVE